MADEDLGRPRASLLDTVKAVGASFFAVTATQSIASIHMGLTDAGTTTSGSFQIDNLTIGDAIPAPGVLALFGVAGFVSRRRRGV